MVTKIFIGERQSGKTYQLCKTIAESYKQGQGYKILCIGYKIDSSQFTAKMILAHFKKINKDITEDSIHAVSINQYVENQSQYKNFHYLVFDNTELILQQLLETDKCQEMFFTLLNNPIVKCNLPNLKNTK